MLGLRVYTVHITKFKKPARCLSEPTFFFFLESGLMGHLALPLPTAFIILFRLRILYIIVISNNFHLLSYMLMLLFI